MSEIPRFWEKCPVLSRADRTVKAGSFRSANHQENAACGVTKYWEGCLVAVYLLETLADVSGVGPMRRGVVLNDGTETLSLGSNFVVVDPISPLW